jgi:S-DNA-T family DNA segregation ATPase FtsK/SpoIIIE
MVNKKEEYVTNGYETPIILGYDKNGGMVIDDLAKMPHLLIGGCTGSGKSIFLINIIDQLTSNFTSQELQLVLFDLKKTEFTCYENCYPHTLGNVITDIKNGVDVLNRLASIMKERSNALESGNEFPRIAVIIDELAELTRYSEEARALITLLTAHAHKVGIHFIAASQIAESTDVVPETLKENFNARASFKMLEEADSISILGVSGAKRISHHGEMLYSSCRFQGVKKVCVPYKNRLKDELLIFKEDLNG